MKRLQAMTAVALTALVVTGCTTVKLKPGAEEIEILKAERVKDCKRLGRTKVSVAEQVGFVKRGEKAIRSDLRKLARNSALDMDGDTLTEESGIENGEQTFGVFDCI